MSLYNALFGTNQIAPILLKIIGKTESDFGRFRDAYVDETGEKIIVYTRCGGGNREDYQHVFDEMELHPNYITNQDDDFDCTYASFKFSIPEEYKKDLQGLRQNATPSQKFQQLITDLQQGKETPSTDKALQVVKKIFGEIEKGLDGTGSNVIKV